MADRSAESFLIRPIRPSDRPRIRQIARERWGGTRIVVHGTVYRLDVLGGFIAEEGGRCCGLLTLRCADNECEIVSLDSFEEGRGVGSALVEAAAQHARQAGCHRLWLVTTNDNLPAIAFYEGRGFFIVAVHHDAVAAARRIKPQIPLVGRGGIPIRDEVELARPLDRPASSDPGRGSLSSEKLEG